MGYCGFRYFENKNPQLINQIEIGYIIDEPFWKKGYASEAIIACIQIGFEKYHFKRILATILPYNIASQKVAVKAGMTHQFDIDIEGLVHFVYEITN